jgi:hypothetical protein
MVLLISAFLLGIIVHASALPTFQQRIPNADKVVSPSGEKWPGVGHYRSSGGGERNTFGDDFAAAGFKWTKELCEKDSDCDGFSNGQELGDPNCIWSEGEIPQFDAGITHPGIADTERSGVAEGVSGRWIDDTCSEFAFENLPSAYFNASFEMPDYEVPTQRTTYVKLAFNLTLKEDAYAVRVAPIIDSPEVLHHMILYQCDSEPKDFLTPSTRGQMACNDLVFAWAVGSKHQCLPPSVGIELDSSRPWYVLDVHYDNPRGISGIKDASGLQIASIPKSAVTDNNFESAGWMWAGAQPKQFSIPPRQSVFELSAECNFSHLPSTGITVFAMALHAHQIGRKIWTEVLRQPETSRRLNEVSIVSCPSYCNTRCGYCFSAGVCCNQLDPNVCLPTGGICCDQCDLCTGCEGCYKKSECNPLGYEGNGQLPDDGDFEPVHDLGCDTRYDFDLQEARPLPEFQTIYPTDKLVTHCVYDSSERSQITYGGDETDDEMCIGFYLYYPKIDNMKCMTSNVEFGVGDGNHVCNMPGQPTVDDTLCYEANDTDFSAGASFSSLKPWLQIHVTCMYLSMGVFIPVGVLIPMSFREFFNENEKWIRLHRIFQSVGILLLLIGCISAFTGTLTPHLNESHHILGLAVFVLALLQPLNAFLRPHKNEAGHTSLSRSLWEMLHKTIGRWTVLGAWVNIFFGIQILENFYGTSSKTSKVMIGVQAGLILLFSLVAIYGAIKSRRSPTRKGEGDNQAKYINNLP